MKINTRRPSDEQNDAARLGRARFVLLTTYRASGESVATAVWVVPDADQVAILTKADSGKVRRLQHNRSVTLVPCNPRGAPNPKATPMLGHAEVLADPDAVARLWKMISRKYAAAHVVLRIPGWLKPAWR